MDYGSMIAGAAQGALGIGQMIAGLAMPKPDIPDYDIPQELFENMTDAEYWSFIGLPEAQKQQFIENTMRSGTSALQQTASRKGGLGAIASIHQSETDAWRGLLVEDVKQRMKNVDRVMQTRRDVASSRDKKFEADLSKVMYERAKRDEMIGAGMQNLGQSFSTFAGGGGFSAFGGGGGSYADGASGQSKAAVKSAGAFQEYDPYLEATPQ